MSDREFSWGPQKRRGDGIPEPLATLVLGLAIIAILVAGVVGVAVHHTKPARTVAVTPAGYQRLLDTTNHVSLAVPTAWKVLPLGTSQLQSNINALKASAPQLAPLLDLAQTGLQRVQPGVFAFDANTRTSIFSYSVDAGTVHTLKDISTRAITAPLTDSGAKKVTATQIRLPLGDAERVTAQLVIGTVTVNEQLDYFVLNHRVVAVVLAVRDAEPPAMLVHQIEGSLAAT